ncbi:MAG: restriction endonuclease [Parabacteroides sp.]
MHVIFKALQAFHPSMQWLIIIIALLTCIAYAPSLFGPNRHQRRRKKAKKVANKLKTFTEGGQILTYLRKIDPFVFEEMLLNAFEACGYKAIRNKRYTGDGGIDGQIIYQDKRIPVQAKRYKNHINKAHMVAFTEVTQKRKAPFGLFIHTGQTGKGSYEVATSSTPILIISGDRLIRLLKEDKPYIQSLLDQFFVRNCLNDSHSIPN